jgi:predicted ATPase/class 3 adenylate cyclase
MGELPTGTITFVFTDIEGSTQLLQALGERYRTVQDAQSRIVRSAIDEARGTVIRTEGDSFFAVFLTPAAAVGAAVAAQRALLSHEWPHSRPLRVRMGMHTGEGVLGGDDYIGIDVNKAARIAAAAWGGQVLLSEATTALVRGRLPHGVAIRSLGRHRLKDLPGEEELFDLVIDRLETAFPPPRTLDAATNLPVELTSFVGREAEVGRVISLFATTRLLTLTGPGGTGKTRLAVRVAAEVSTGFPDGAFFVDLAPITDPALVIPTIAVALQIREEGWERPIEEALKDYLRDRRLFLVLDNFEQVLDAAPLVTDLLGSAPALKVLVTSRAPLGVRGEQDVPVAPLDVPSPHRLPPLEDLGVKESVVLFTDRATAVAPDFRLTEENAAQVAAIVSRLDGLPLAIELAASRSAVFSPAAMLERIERRLPLLAGGPRDAPSRQKTLGAAFGWSYELLEDRDRILFRRLSVLIGGSTVDAAAAVCDPDRTLGIDILEGLVTLVENSLAYTIEPPGEDVRFGMLTTVREFGLDRLDEEDDRLAIERCHAEWFLRLAETAEPHFRGPDLDRWLNALKVEHDNLRAALRWAIDNDEANVGLRLAAALWRFWHLGGHLSEGRLWVDAVLALPSAASPTLERARALAAAGGLAYWQLDTPAVLTRYEEALAISCDLEDDAEVAEATYNLAFAHGLGPGRGRAEELFLDCRRMFGKLGNTRGVADALSFLSSFTRRDGDLHLARRQAEESLRMHEEIGDLFGLMDSLHELGMAALGMGDLETARSCFIQSLDALAPLGYRTLVAIVLDQLAAEAIARGWPLRAVRLAGASESLKEAAGGRAPPEFMDLPDPREIVRPLLSDEQIASVWDEGRAMTLEEAAAYARADPDAEAPFTVQDQGSGPG